MSAGYAEGYHYGQMEMGRVLAGFMRQMGETSFVLPTKEFMEAEQFTLWIEDVPKEAGKRYVLVEPSVLPKGDTQP